MATGHILYRGPSMLDGAPIVAIATIRRSKNSKTGPMIQTWILRSDIDPLTAVRLGRDASICGDCVHRGTLGSRTCYVNLRAPLSVWRAFKRGTYKRLPASLDYTGRTVRLGAYGDPAAVPVEVWLRVLRGTAGHTGYTHAWRYADIRFSQLIMASADSPADVVWAQSLGYRTFRASAAGDLRRMEREILCPASAEAGQRTQCAHCRLCNGARPGDRRALIMIPAHGVMKSRVLTLQPV